MRKSKYLARLAISAAIVWALTLLVSSPALAGDPSGGDTLTGNPLAAVNFTWTLMSAYLVAFMVLGFALLEAGFCRSKNSANVLMKNVFGPAAGALAYWILGFGFMFGGAIAGIDVVSRLLGPEGWGLIGASGFFLSVGGAYDVSVYELFMFQVVFALTAVTICSGAMAERTKFIAYCLYTFAAGAILYPIFGSWVWGGGWLSTLGDTLGLGVGYRDFAGSTVVHAIGGAGALVGAWLVGPRMGKFNPDGTPNAIPGHSLPLATLGTIILWFGWFGFNAGSTLAATDLRISVIALNTFLAACAGTLAATVYSWRRSGKPDPGLILNGSLAGLVAITAPCAYVESWAAIVIGLIAGVLVIESVRFFDRVAKIDDPVGAISVHLVNGIWGALALGIFADGTYGGVSGLITGNFGQFVAQLIGASTAFVWGVSIGLIIFSIIKAVVGLRVSPEEEFTGLDMGEHGVSSYPEFVHTTRG